MSFFGVLPPGRREWQCGEYWENGEKKFRDDGCEQWIYQSDTRKFRSGKGMVLNSRDGPGGKKEDPHVCPKRVGSKWHRADNFFNKMEYRYHQQYKGCPSCAQTFNNEVYPLCPTCFKLQCRKCPSMQIWIVQKDHDNWKCLACGAIGMDVAMVFRAEDRQRLEEEGKPMISAWSSVGASVSH